MTVDVYSHTSGVVGAVRIVNPVLFDKAIINIARTVLGLYKSLEFSSEFSNIEGCYVGITHVKYPLSKVHIKLYQKTRGIFVFPLSMYLR